MIFSKVSTLILAFCLLSTIGTCQQSLSSLKVNVNDQLNNKPTPVRVKITDSKGHVTAIPDNAIAVMYGRNDKPERYGYQPDSSFYVDGNFTTKLNGGTYTINLSKGVEYLDQEHTINLKPGEHKDLNIEMKRWINMPDSGWYSADDHIHIRRSPRENPLILKWVEAEGLNIGVMLQMGDLWTTYFSQYAFGENGVYQQQESLLTTGQEEPRTHEVGHTIAMVADDFVRFQNDYYYYDKVFDRVHELNGIMGYAHQGMSFHGSRGMTMDVLDGNVDFLELLQFCVEGGPLLTQNYYRFLDLGYKLTATAGSDFPWCGNGPNFGTEAPSWNARIGNVRFYTHINEEFNYKSWKKNLVAGNTFVTSGPMIIFDVNDKLPGDEINLEKKGNVVISARAYGHQQQVPLTKLEIVSHGKVIKEVTATGENKEFLSINFELEIEWGTWVVARCFAGPTQVAHTTPIYITMGNKGFGNPATINDYLTESENYLDELDSVLNSPSESISRRAWWYKKGLKERIEETRNVINLLKEKEN